MYLPDHFAEKNLIKLHQHIQQHPFGMLVTNGHNGLDANHLPFYLTVTPEKTTVLTTHVALANPIYSNVNNEDDVLVVFKAADHYISPNWYPSKHETQEQVPTWNYIVVHAHGKIKFKTDEKPYDLKKDLENYSKKLSSQKSKKLISKSFKSIKELAKYKYEPVLNHHDLNPKNILFTQNSLKIIDWEYAGINDRFFDLACVCVEFKLTKNEEKIVLNNYFKNPKKYHKIKLKHYKIIYDSFCKLWFEANS